MPQAPVAEAQSKPLGVGVGVREAVHTARNGCIASVYRDSMSVRVGVEANGLGYTFTHDEAYGVDSLVAWAGGIVVKVRVDDKFGYITLTGGRARRVPGNVGRLIMALLITAVARGSLGLFMIAHRLAVYLPWRR
jgi:hypothetical protein